MNRQIRIRSLVASLLRRCLADDFKNLVTRSESEEIAQRAYLQSEAYVQLVARLGDFRAQALRGYAVSPDACLALMDIVEAERPMTVLELGSGASTVVLATALQRSAPEARLISIDHSETYAKATTELLQRYGLTNGHVRTADLVAFRGSEGTERTWYDEAKLTDLSDIDLVFIDGPPPNPSGDARSPSLEALQQRISSRAIIVLDDAARPADSELAKRWADAIGGTLRFLRAEKGLAVVRSAP